MVKEHVLIWPEQFALYLKGLAEDNGAFVLDAIESWPNCGVDTDSQGINCYTLPPIYYLVLGRPDAEQTSGDVQHLIELSAEQEQFILSTTCYLESCFQNKDQLLLKLLQVANKYSSLSIQFVNFDFFKLDGLLNERALFESMDYCIHMGLKLSNPVVISSWQEPGFRPVLQKYLPECALDADVLPHAILEAIVSGKRLWPLYDHLVKDQIDLSSLQSMLFQLLDSEKADEQACLDLLERGVDIDSRDKQGNTLLMLAAQQGFITFCTRLVEKGCNLSLTNNFGFTAGHLSINSQSGPQLEVLRCLLNHGLVAEATDEHSPSLYSYALENKSFSVVRMLESEFNIRELSAKNKKRRVISVHGLHALVCLLLPLQLMLFFSELSTNKSAALLSVTLSSLVLFSIAIKLKRDGLYPKTVHPYSLTGLRWCSPFSLILQVALSCLVISNWLS